MAILWMDGFDHYAKDLETVDAIGFAAENTGGICYRDAYSNYVPTEVRNAMREGALRSLRNAGYEVNSYNSSNTTGGYIVNMFTSLRGRKQGYGICMMDTNYSSTPITQYISKTFGPWESLLVFGFAVNLQYRNTTAYTHQLISLSTPYGHVFELSANAYHPDELVLSTEFKQFTVDENDPSTQYADGESANSLKQFIPNVWNWVEVEIDTVSGNIRLYVNGNYECSVLMNSIPLSQLQEGGTVYLGGTESRSDIYRMFDDGATRRSRGRTYRKITFDDFYILDGSGEFNNRRIGNTQIYTRKPTADTTKTFLNGSLDELESNASFLDEDAPDYDDTFVYADTVGSTDLFSTDQAIPDSEILAVALAVSARRSGEDDRELVPVVVSAETEGLGAVTSLDLLDYKVVTHVYNSDPALGPWTKDAISTLQFGYKISK